MKQTKNLHINIHKKSKSWKLCCAGYVEYGYAQKTKYWWSI